MSHVDDGFRSLTLKRFPQTDDVNPLLAWEAADEYLLQQLDETEIRGPVLILNDTFGALSCALAEHSPYSIGDSYLSELGTRENLRHNGIAESSVTFLDSTADYPQANVVFVDESPMAVDSSRLNVETNLPEAFERCEFMINNALSGVEPFRFNAVFCNPPFHQKHALTDNIAWEMFHHARRCLKINGELYIVANRHLDYFHKLKKIFGNCATIATNNKFVILKAVKQGRRR